MTPFGWPPGPFRGLRLEPAGKADIVSMHGKVKGPIASIPKHPLGASTLPGLWDEVRTSWKALDHKAKMSRFQM